MRADGTQMIRYESYGKCVNQCVIVTNEEIIYTHINKTSNHKKEEQIRERY